MRMSNPPAQATPGRVVLAFLLALTLCAAIAVAFALIAPFGLTSDHLTPAVLGQMVGGSLALHLVPLRAIASAPWLIAPVIALPVLGRVTARSLMRRTGAGLVNLTLIFDALLILWDLFAGWCLHMGFAG
ncbi:hypothetical protein [Aliiroseovarius sp.]|uniref:hypothetical protein n=1 Tax=Aliiroseovarius sp. TaxID=1872442 RepID=UPI003BA8F8FA